MALLLNEQIDGKYEILEKIREGGMGAIYKVRHRLLDEVRVVKVIRSQSEAVGEAADRFLSEAKAAIKLRHPNVAILHDFAVGDDGQAFIVMEYIDGWNLLEVLNGYGPPPVALTLEIARQSLKALGYLHRHKIVHRDVSPDNLMLTRDVDGNPLIKLIDLGIAKTLEGQGGLTTTGVFLGKPRYGSPERFSGAAFDERSDLYSFGVVLYELLTGCSPVTGAEPAALMAGHLFRPPLDFATTDPEGRVPAELQAIVLKSLAKKPEERLPSAEDFVWELTLLQDRFPLTREETEGVWRVLLPLAPGSVPAQEPPGSTQDHLDLQFGMATTPATGTITTLTSEATLRTEAATPPLAEVIPFSPATPRVTTPSPGLQPTQRIGSPEDLDSTWASRPMRVRPAAPEPETPAPPPPARLRGAAVANSSRHSGLWIAVAGAVLVLAGVSVGVWLARRPEGAKIAEPRPPAPTVLPASTASLTPTPPPPAQPTPVQTTPAPVVPKPTPHRKPVTTEPAPAPESLGPMTLGDTIRQGQPHVEEPEVKQLPSYSYPPAAKGSGRKVTIRVAVLVDENGQVIDAKIRSGDNSGLGFEESALEAARKARFFPATRDGIAGKMWTELLLDFAE